MHIVHIVTPSGECQLKPDCLIPGVRGAEGPFSPVVSTMLPSVCTTMRVAFSGFKLSPICRAVLPDCRGNKELKSMELKDQCGLIQAPIRSKVP